MKRIIALLLLACTHGVCAVPDGEAGIASAAQYSQSRGETSLLVWRDGRVIYEHRPSTSAPPRIFSITKSLVSIGVFRDAMSGGLSLGDTAVFGAARGIPLVDLLNQTSGLDPAQKEFYSQGLKDKESVLQKLTRRGTGRFVYGPSHWEVLAEEIRLRRGGAVEGWLRKFVPGASAAAVARWTHDDHGRLFFSTGARMDARDLLPAGRETLRGLRDGRWPAEVRSRLAQGTDANRMYALGFWLNHGADLANAKEVDVESSLGGSCDPEFWRNACLSRSAPSDLVAMIGTRGQRVYVVPSRNLVIIRLGEGSGFSDAEFLGRFFARDQRAGIPAGSARGA